MRVTLAVPVVVWFAISSCGGASPEQRDALRVAAAALAGCPESDLRLSGRHGRYLVEGCLRRVGVECEFEQGQRTCLTSEDAELARDARRRREAAIAEASRERRERELREQRTRSSETAGGTRTRDSFGRRAAFTTESGAIQLDLRAYTIRVVARASEEHREVLVSVSLDARAARDCDERELSAFRGDDVVARHAADRVVDDTSHHVVPGEAFDALLDHTPLSLRSCDEIVSIESAELAALRRFVAARRSTHSP